MNPDYADMVAVADNGCWIWTGRIQARGYGMKSQVLAHRYVYELEVGPIPAGLQIDHTCHSFDETCEGGDDCLHRRCVNPAHLEPVTPIVNVHRGRGPSGLAARKTHCPKGHPYAGDNLRFKADGSRLCATCKPPRGPFVDAAPTRRLIADLVDAGLSQLEIARRAGIGRNICSGERIDVARAQAIAEVHARFAKQGRAAESLEEAYAFADAHPLPDVPTRGAQLVERAS